MDVESTGTTIKKEINRSSKRFREKNSFPNPSLVKLDKYSSTNNSRRNFSPIPKLKFTRRNYGEQEMDEIKNEGKDEELMEKEPNIPFPSRVSNTFKMESLS